MKKKSDSIRTTKNGDKGKRLYSLIHSLSSKDKENFTKYSKLKGRTGKIPDGQDKLPVELFKLLNNQEAFDEEEVKMKFPKLAPKIGDFYEKVYTTIRASLVWYSKDKEGELIMLYREIKEIIKRGGDYQGAWKVNKGLIKLTRELDYPEIEIQACRQRNLILKKLEYYDELYGSYPKFIAELEDARDKATSLHNFEFGYHFYHSIIKQNYHARQELDEKHLLELENHSLYSKLYKAVTPKSKIYYYLMRYFTTVFKEDWLGCLKNLKKVVRIFDQHPQLISDLEEIYLDQIYKLALVPTNHNPAQGIPFQKRLKNYSSQNKRMMAIARQGYWIATITYSIDGHTDRNTIYESVADLESDLSSFGSYMGIEHRYIIYFSIGKMYFEKGDFAPAMEWLNKVIKFQNPAIRRDIQGIARILYLLCLVELEVKPIEMEGVARRFNTWLKKQSKYFEFEKRVYKFINAYPLPPMEADQKLVYAELAQDLEKVFELRYEKKINGYFDFVGWAKSKSDR